MAAKPKPKTRIQRAGNGHSYYLDGVKVPGVTTILGNGIPKPALVNWSAAQTASFVVNRLTVAEDGTIVANDVVRDLHTVNNESRYPVKISTADRLDRVPLEKILTNIRYRDRDEAARRGTEVHNLAERIARGEEVEVPEPLTGHVSSYVQFLDEWEPENAILEAVVINRQWHYMGKLDMIAEFPGRVWPDGDPLAGQPVGRGLLDVKTSRSGIFADVALQLEAYAHGETMLVTPTEEVDLPPIEWVGAIHVRADGYDLYRFHRGDDGTGDDTFRIFLYAYEIGQWLDRDNGAAGTIRSDSLSAPEASP